MSFELSPIAFEGRKVRLELLAQDHAQGLFNRGRTAADWTYMPRACFVDMADTRQWIEDACISPSQQAFAIIEKTKNKVVGSTRFLNIRSDHRGLEIGWTWLSNEWQRTGVNTEVKFLLLRHAFERMGCIRVEFKADARNARSLAALERIGATREGVLRQHMIVQGEYARDSVYFSVLDTEWNDVKSRLLQLLEVA